MFSIRVTFCVSLYPRLSVKTIYIRYIRVCVCEGKIKVGNKIDRLFRGRKRKKEVTRIVGCFVRDGRRSQMRVIGRRKLLSRNPPIRSLLLAVHFLRNIATKIELCCTWDSIFRQDAFSVLL